MIPQLSATEAQREGSDSTSQMMSLLTSESIMDATPLDKNSIINVVLEIWLAANSNDELIYFTSYETDSHDLVFYGVDWDSDKIHVYFIANLWPQIQENYPNASDFDEEDESSHMPLVCTCIGHLEVRERYDDDTKWLFSVNVDSNYQKKGIGRQLIKLAIEHLELECFPEGGRLQNNDDFYLSDEGAFLINSCISKGIIKRPPTTPISSVGNDHEDFDAPGETPRFQ